MASETIYLCNFRVSVDGEWLCLRELGDISMSPQSVRSPSDDDDSVIKNPVLVERANLLNVAKLCIKTLIESALEEARTLGDDHVPLQQFFVVMEHVLNHGLKGKKTFLEKKRSFWGACEALEKASPEAAEIIDSVRNLPGIKTSLGRGRAWLRLALMQKKLADYFRMMMENKELLGEHYEPVALMMEEEAAVIAGLLVGLNVIDCNLCLKGDDLDNAPSVIDFSLYFKEGNYLDKPENGSASNQSINLAAVLDQKNYLEEHNRHLTSQVQVLQARIKTLEEANRNMKEELAKANNDIISLQTENQQLRNENTNIQDTVERKLKLAKQDIEVERETYQTSRSGLNEMYSEAKEKLQYEAQRRQDVEQELELQKSLKTEMEMAMQLMEKDIHEKQDSIISLRKQLEEIKNINLGLYSKVQATDSSIQHKTNLVSKLEEKTNQMEVAIKNLEERLKTCNSDRIAAEETARKLGQVLAEKDSKCSALEADLKVEMEWKASLRADLEKEHALVEKLKEDVREMEKLKREIAELHSQHEELRKTCEEQEQTLADMGNKLSDKVLTLEGMRESVQKAETRVWADDENVKECTSCQKAFSVSRRKHHCRNCGGIFCHQCSEKTMPLPSFAKPVRVCDACFDDFRSRTNAR
ncbi:RUN and FYVE domain-containing protein 2 [Holothuria leucospilota]|uniref:RUN and FYVE domain-containing protein 2 n=1 Tax=Holothuria leucospilota TaxID=206669 RepID=A0A9Q0YQ36_HOLLE|nr:RUN and FYVE domain-containing protein 2 [Holothuria leucospilota]